MWIITYPVHYHSILQISLAVVVLDELADASVAVFLASAFLALFVLLANRIEWVNWVTVAHVGHWSIA